MAHQRSFLCFHDVTFTYGGAAEPAVRDLHLTVPAGWTGVVGANGCGKTTLLRLAAGELRPGSGRVDGGSRGLYCEQRTDEAPPRLAEMLLAEGREARRLRTVLGLAPDWAARWATLSHGERKRAQVAVALWLDPEVLALDEPTNHLDLLSVECLEEALDGCAAALLLVSHDGRFLARLARRLWRIGPSGAPGTWQLGERDVGELEPAPSGR